MAAMIGEVPVKRLVDDIPVAAEWVRGNLIASGYAADWSVASLKEVDRFIENENRPGGALDGKAGSILFGLGCYVGQVLIRAYGGQWVTDDADPQGEVNVAVRLGGGAMVWPVQRVVKCVKEGPDNAIYPYAVVLARRSATGM